VGGGLNYDVKDSLMAKGVGTYIGLGRKFSYRSATNDQSNDYNDAGYFLKPFCVSGCYSRRDWLPFSLC
jgi:hypothetical protein